MEGTRNTEESKRTDLLFEPIRGFNNYGQKTSDIGNFKYRGRKDWVRPKDFPMIFMTILMISVPTFYYLIFM
jgi:hypothetical protein